MRPILPKSWRLGALILIATTLFMSLCHLLGILDALEHKTYDLRFRLRGTTSIKDSPIVLVTIDDQSLVSLQKKWPFPRAYFARAIENLAAAGAGFIILDVEFTEPSATNPFDDYQLAQAIRKFPRVVLAGKVVTEYHRSGTINQFPLKPLPELLAAGARWGYANIHLDEDGFLRRYSLFHQLHGTTYFPLAVEALAAIQKVPGQTANFDAQGQLVVGKIHIPFNADGSILINYSGAAQHFPTYSFANILDDAQFSLPDVNEDTDIFEQYKAAGIFKKKIVIIGAGADELQDNRLTPFFNFDGSRRLMPGAEIHANALQTILTGDYIVPSPWWLTPLMVLTVGLIGLIISARLRPIWGLLTGLVFGLVYAGSTFLFFAQWNLWLPLVAPLLNFVACYIFTIVHKIVLEQREKGRYRKTFQQYVARSVVDAMLNSGQLPQFGGERKTLTVLFSDIRAFTSYSEKYPPEIVVQRLTEYLSSMVDVVFQHGGTLDKFVGDEIMALYGAPYYFENHAERACETALDMVARLRSLQKSWSEKAVEYFQIGIGINTGKVIVGNLGSIQLFDYTVIGDEVNLGARLEGANKHYSTTIIISDSTYQEVKDIAIVRELDVVRVKGKNHPVKIYELRGMHSLPSIEKELIIDVYSYALELFKQRKWNLALKEFRRVLRYFPSDGPSRVYTVRCLEFIEQPPAENWDGVFEFAVK
ncbi:MAG: adenylate/guanylate cyclase domain-containing protein [candidate division KSB1 bacterium]|nr:adenylate/guanylate cyclase domain-containing protein [candidate division KSB1 bacterium]MDZ7341178.1 adenylate/guanylate cyclase domain-containing protein [candidate division KSB1 bacterium]